MQYANDTGNTHFVGAKARATLKHTFVLVAVRYGEISSKKNWKIYKKSTTAYMPLECLTLLSYIVKL